MSAAITPEQAARDCSAQIEKDRATLEEAGIAAWPAVRFATGAHLREALALLDAERAARQEAERERDAAILRHDEDLGRMQRVVYDALCAAVKDTLPGEPLSRIDGAGSDGDEFDFTAAEVSIACGLLTDALDEARRERDARPDPGALLAALDTIRAAAATGARPAELARMVEDVQAGMIRPPTGDATLLTTKEPS